MSTHSTPYDTDAAVKRVKELSDRVIELTKQGICKVDDRLSV
jgi:hypothetical protein